MIDNLALLWFSLVFFFLFLEMGNPGLLYFLSFSCGALMALMVNLMHVSLETQLIFFLVSSCSTIINIYLWTHLYRKFFGTKSQRDIPSHRTNIDALIGKKAIVFVFQDNPAIFQVKIVGQVWQVRSIDDKPLQQGEQVIIVDVQGCHLRVDRLS